MASIVVIALPDSFVQSVVRLDGVLLDETAMYRLLFDVELPSWTVAKKRRS